MTTVYGLLGRTQRQVQPSPMHLHVHTPIHHDSPSIGVCGEEVPLSLYWHAVDLWAAGHTPDSIVVHIVATNNISNVEWLRNIVQNIVYNQELIHQESLLTPTNNMTRSHSRPEARRHSRILNVGELDDLHVAHMVAEKKEKERAGLRHLLSKLG